MSELKPEDMAQLFHEAYERLAPSFGYKTRDASAVAWENVPANNKLLMIATCKEIMGKRNTSAIESAVLRRVADKLFSREGELMRSVHSLVTAEADRIDKGSDNG